MTIIQNPHNNAYVNVRRDMYDAQLSTDHCHHYDVHSNEILIMTSIHVFHNTLINNYDD